MKDHLCETCGESNPTNFDKRRKGICILCYKEYQKEYYQNKKEHFREKNRDYQRNYQSVRKKEDPSFKCVNNIRSRQSAVIRGKSSTTKGLGCSRQELRDYLESLFTEGMTFDNYGKGPGKWNIDHIEPISLHDKNESGDWCTESEYNKKLMHYTNMQPLWEEDNIKKSNKV